MNKPFYYFCSAIILFFFTFCTDDISEQTSIINSKNLTSNIQLEFSKSQFSNYNSFINNQLEVNWNSYNNFPSLDSSGVWREYTIKPTHPRNFQNSGLVKGEYFSLLSYSNQSKNEIYIAKILNYRNNEQVQFHELRKNYFNGLVYLYSLNGKMNFVFHYQKGKVVGLIENLDDPNSESIEEKLAVSKSDCYQKQSLTLKCENTWNCTGPSGGGEDYGGSSCGGSSSTGEYVWMKTGVDYWDWYNDRGDHLEYSHTNMEDRYEWVFVQSGYSYNHYSYNDSYTYSVRQTSPEGYTTGTKNYSSKPYGAPTNPEYIYMDENLKAQPCAKGALKRLTASENELIKGTLEKFEDDPNYHLILTKGDCATSNEACLSTRLFENHGMLIVKIENTQASIVKIASLILHESLHAEMHRYVARYEAGVDPSNRKRLLQLFAYYKGWAEKYASYHNWKETAHHEYMAERYVQPMAEALRSIDNNKFPVEYYMGYAWRGLEDSGYAQSQLTTDKKDEYDNYLQVVESNADPCPTR